MNESERARIGKKGKPKNDNIPTTRYDICFAKIKSNVNKTDK